MLHFFTELVLECIGQLTIESAVLWPLVEALDWVVDEFTWPK